MTPVDSNFQLPDAHERPPRSKKELDPRLVEWSRKQKARQNTLRARLRRKLYSIRARILNVIYSLVQFTWKWTLRDWLDKRFFVKMAHTSPSCEIGALRFVRCRTTIPVPYVLGFFFWRQSSWIVMQRMPGTALELVWETFNEDEKEAICRQLKTWMDELRELRSPYGRRVCSAVGGSMRDGRLIFLDDAGPFVEELHMNCQMGYPGGRPLRDDEPASLKVAFHRALEGTHRIVFTHGDLAPRNILVQDGAVTAIVDWEASGWFPEHWEYVKAHYTLGWRQWLHDSWGPYIRTFLTPYDKEKEADDYIAALTFPGPDRNMPADEWMEVREEYLRLRPVEVDVHEESGSRSETIS